MKPSGSNLDDWFPIHGVPMARVLYCDQRKGYCLLLGHRADLNRPQRALKGGWGGLGMH